MSDSITAPAQLSITPGLLRTMIAGLTADELAWKPAPGRFSIAEALGHLAHCETFAYRPKYRQFAVPVDSLLEPYDVERFTAEGVYSARPAEASLSDFERQRQANLAAVQGLPNRTLRHHKVGPISLSELLNECAFHDLGHIRQIAELIRAQKYYPNIGLYSQFYKVNP
jgi:hypothetical protein